MKSTKAVIEQYTVSRAQRGIIIEGTISVRTKRQSGAEHHNVKGCYMTRFEWFAKWAFKRQCRAFGRQLQQIDGPFLVHPEKQPSGLLGT